MDCDTIVTSDKIVNLLNTDKDFIQFGKHIGFIAANKESIILSKWLKEIKIRLFIHKYFRFFLKKFDKNYRQKYTNWDFLGNSILDKLLLNSTSNDYLSLDRIKLKVLPEINYYMNTYKDQDDTNLREMYRKFYFENDFSDYALDNECGIILLHNSRTPYEYQTFNKEEFLKENNTLSNIFKKLLDGDLWYEN